MIPVLFVSTFAFAGTTEQTIVDAAKATIEKARADGSAITFTSNHNIKTTQRAGYQYIPTDVTSREVQLNISSMRAQAELYYSNKNNYGASTASCYGGMFGDSKNGGLKTLMVDTFKKTKTINCVATAPTKTKKDGTWMVIAKVGTKFMCADNTGSMMYVGGFAKKTVSSCVSAPKTPATTVSSSISTSVSLYPKVGSGYDLSYNIKLNRMGELSTYSSITKKDVTYKLIDDYFLRLFSEEGKGAVSAATLSALKGKYILIPQNGSMIAYAYGKSSVELEKAVTTALDPKRFTAAYVSTNVLGEQVYRVSVPLKTLTSMSSSLIGKEVGYNMSGALGDVSVKFDVKIKNGLITAISTNNQILKSTDVTDTFIGSARVVPGMMLPEPAGIQTVTCRDLLSQLNVSEEQKQYACDVMTEQELTAEAQGKAKDAAGQAYLSNLRAMAELYYSNTNSYGPVVASCSVGIFADKNTQGGLGGNITQLGLIATELSCVTGGTITQAGSQSWRVSARVASGKYWCSDSTGNLKEISSPLPLSEVTCR